jgi:hypothetical protein
LHPRANGNFAHHGAGVGSSSESVGEIGRDPKPSASDAEQLCIGIVIVLVSFDIEKDEACFCVAHREIELLARCELFD